jgi:hypothetical protein
LHWLAYYSDGAGFRRRHCSGSHWLIWLIGVAGKFAINYVKYRCGSMPCRRQVLVRLDRIAAANRLMILSGADRPSRKIASIANLSQPEDLTIERNLFLGRLLSQKPGHKPSLAGVQRAGSRLENVL